MTLSATNKNYGETTFTGSIQIPIFTSPVSYEFVCKLDSDEKIKYLIASRGYSENFLFDVYSHSSALKDHKFEESQSTTFYKKSTVNIGTIPSYFNISFEKINYRSVPSPSFLNIKNAIILADSDRKQTINKYILNAIVEGKNLNQITSDFATDFDTYTIQSEAIFGNEILQQIEEDGIELSKDAFFLGYILYKFDSLGRIIKKVYFDIEDLENAVEYVDTQIIPGNLYSYKIAGLFAYSGNILNDISIFEWDLIDTISGVAIDLIPVNPEIAFIPIADINNKINIIVNTNYNNHEAIPILFNEREETYIKYAKKSESDTTKKSESDTTKVIFSGEAQKQKIVIYRMDKKPYSYKDFSSNILEEIDLNGYTDAHYEDTLQPNKTYYYCARVSTINNILSNPSTVYSVKIVDDGGLVYLECFPYDIDKNKVELFIQPNKTFNKFFSLQPNKLHMKKKTEVSIGNKDDALDSVGALNPSIWGSEFKIRIISKSTGRKIDINLPFKKQNK